ncbi:MAG: hypothetical protein ACRC17_01865 [Culicoidibacterales bacterium]
MQPFIYLTTKPGQQIDEPNRFIISEKTTWATLQKVLTNSEVILVSESVMDQFHAELTQWYLQQRQTTYVVAHQPTDYAVPTLICPSEIESVHDFAAYWPSTIK